MTPIHQLRIRHRHAAEFGLPVVEGGFPHTMLAAQVCALRACLVLRQNADDLFVSKSCSLLRPSSNWGEL